MAWARAIQPRAYRERDHHVDGGAIGANDGVADPLVVSVGCGIGLNVGKRAGLECLMARGWVDPGGGQVVRKVDENLVGEEKRDTCSVVLEQAQALRGVVEKAGGEMGCGLYVLESRMSGLKLNEGIWTAPADGGGEGGTGGLVDKRLHCGPFLIG
jgi:hypothetical protein